MIPDGVSARLESLDGIGSKAFFHTRLALGDTRGCPNFSLIVASSNSFDGPV
jgi:hypothetical protein